MSANPPTELELLRAKARLHQLEVRQSSDELVSMISTVKELQSFKSLLPLAGVGASAALLVFLLRRHRSSPFLAALGVIVDALRLAVLSGVIGDRNQESLPQIDESRSDRLATSKLEGSGLRRGANGAATTTQY